MLAPVVADKPVAGDHIYDVELPLAVKPVEEPVQIATLEPALIVGNGLTVTTTLAVSLQVFTSVPVTIYVVVTVGLAVTLAPTVADKPVAGDQEYDVEVPLAVKPVEKPVQIATLDPALTVGNGLTVTVTLDVLLHELASVPVTT